MNPFVHRLFRQRHYSTRIRRTTRDHGYLLSTRIQIFGQLSKHLGRAREIRVKISINERYAHSVGTSLFRTDSQQSDYTKGVLIRYTLGDSRGCSWASMLL